jgi:hypothetical protein
MANIPLSEIPNAPTAVFTPTASANFNVEGAANQVAGQAKADIAQGYDASKVNPQAAGAIGRAISDLGNGIDRGAQGVAGGLILMDAASRRQQLEEASRTGVIKKFQNEANVQNNYADLMKDQPAGMAGAMWLKAAGQNGENLLQGMNPYETYAMLPDAMHTFHTGVVSAVHADRSAYTQDQEAQGNIQFTSLYNQQNWAGADKVNEAQWQLRHITEPQYLSNKQAIEVGQQKQGLSQDIASSLAGDGAFAKQVADTAQQEKPLQGYEQLSPKQLGDAYKVGNYLNGKRMDAAQDNVLNRVDTGVVSSPEQLSKLPEWNQMDKDRQDALIQRLNYNKVGTPQGEIDFKNAKQLVDNYPPTGDSNNVKDYWDARNFIIANVADGGQSKALLGELDKKNTEMAGNSGQLKPQTQVNQWLSQSLTEMLKNNSFGAFDPDLKGGTPEQLKANLNALNTKEDIYEAVLAKNPKNRMEAQNALDEAINSPAIQKKQWGAGASEGLNNSPSGFWNWIKGSKPQASNDGWNDGTATSFGTNVNGTPDKADNGNGKYAGTKTADPHYQGASLSEAQLRAHGIDPENKDQVAQHEVEVRNGDKTVRVPIADLGPANWVEARQGPTVDLTGAVHRELGTNGKSPVKWRIVPKNIS